MYRWAALGMPAYISDRIPFPGPALAARILDELTPDRVKIVRKATAIVEKELSGMKVFSPIQTGFALLWIVLD